MCNKFDGQCEGMRSFLNPERRRKNNMKIDLTVIRYEGVGWVYLIHDKGQSRASVKTIMNLRIQQNSGNYLAGSETINFSTRTLLHVVIERLCMSYCDAINLSVTL